MFRSEFGAVHRHMVVAIADAHRPPHRDDGVKRPPIGNPVARVEPHGLDGRAVVENILVDTRGLAGDVVENERANGAAWCKHRFGTDSGKLSGTGQRGISFESGRAKLVGRLFLADAERPGPTALVLHGVPGIEQNHDVAHALRGGGWNAVIFHYRGCWGSKGSFTIRGMLDDVRAAVDHLTSGAVAEVDPTRVIAVGHSLGGWAAVLAACEDFRLRGVGVYGMIPDPRPYEDSEELIESDCVPWLDGITARAFKQEYASLDDRHSPIDRVHELAPRPLLVVHGAKDEGVPIADAEAFFRRAAEPKRFAVHPEADHDFTWHREWLGREIVSWTRRLMRGHTRASS